MAASTWPNKEVFNLKGKYINKETEPLSPDSSNVDLLQILSRFNEPSIFVEC